MWVYILGRNQLTRFAIQSARSKLGSHAQRQFALGLISYNPHRRSSSPTERHRFDRERFNPLGSGQILDDGAPISYPTLRCCQNQVQE